MVKRSVSNVRRMSQYQEIVVVADAACACRDNLALIKKLGYWYVVAHP